MADEPENLSLRLLQELRFDMRDLTAGLEEVRSEIQEMRIDLTQRIDGNTMILNLIAGVTHDHEQRITDLESR